MKKVILFSSFFSAMALVMTTSVVHSSINQPPIGAAGAPPSGATCSQGGGCHNGTAIADDSRFALHITTDSTLLADASTIASNTSTFIAGTTYFASLQLNGNAFDYGFEMVSFNGSNAQAGSFTKTDATHTSLQNFSGKQYLGHKNASSTKTFNFKWTAPATVEAVTFYYTANFGNGNGQPSGDSIFKSSLTVNVDTASLPTGIKNVENVSNFNVYPTQTLSNVSVKLHTQATQSATISLVDMSGKLVKVLHNGILNEGENEFIFNISDIPQGVYLLNLRAGSSQISKHVVRL